MGFSKTMRQGPVKHLSSLSCSQIVVNKEGGVAR